MESLLSDGLLLATNSEAYETGRHVGQLIWLAILIAGLLKCQQVARRPTASSKCLYALAAVLFGFLLSIIASIFRSEGGYGQVVAIVSSLAMLATTLVAILLAILGLVELSVRKEASLQGKKQAIWAIVLSVFMWGLMGVGVIVALRERFGVPDDLKVAQVEAESVLTFDAQNFRFRAPPRPWQKVDVKRLNPDATLAFLRAQPQVFMMVIAERVDVDPGLDTEGLVAVVKANMQSATTETRFVEDAPLTVNGMAGHLVATRSKMAGQSFHHVVWMYARNGYFFQFMVWGAQRNGADVRKAFDELADRFEVIDLDRHAATEGPVTGKDVPSPAFPYVLKLAGTRWTPWENLNEEMSEAETAAQLGTLACVAVIPISLEELDPSQEALLSGLLARVDIEYPGYSLEGMKEITDGPYQGVQFDYDKTIDKVNYRYRCRVVRGGGCAYLIRSWIVNDGKGKRANLLDEGLERVLLSRPPGPPTPVAERSTNSRQNQAFALNDIGVYYYNARHYAKSIPYYRAAVEAYPDDDVILDNLAGAYVDCQQEKEALEAIEKYGARFQKNAKLLKRRAQLLVALERGEEACAVYAELFSGDHESEEDLTAYVDLLAARGQLDRALEVLKAYRARRDSLDLLLNHAWVLSEKEDWKGAVALLRERQAKMPFNAEIAYALIEYLGQAEEHAEALQVCQQLLDNGFDSAQAWFEKGVCEERLKWYAQAKASFEEALKKAPRDQTVRTWLDHVSGILGEGDNSGVKKVIEPVPMPPAWLAPDGADVPEEYVKDYSAYYVRRLTAVSFVAGKDYRVSEYRMARVVDLTGVARFSTFQFRFDPLAEEIHLNHLTVRDAEGRVVSKGKISDCYVIDEGGEQATQRKVLNVPIPGLLPGHVIELMVTRKDNAPPEKMPFLAHGFMTGYPVLRAGFHLCGDVRAVTVQTGAGVEVVRAGETLSSMVECPSVYRSERDQPDVRTFQPMLWVNASNADWKEVGESCLDEIAATLEPDPAVPPVASGLLEGKATVRDKLDVFVRYLQDNYTYRAIEFGRRAHVPNCPGTILRNRYGDCKDHALLLFHLLRHAGIEAHLALTDTGSAFRPEMPSVDQFGHMILYVPGEGGGRFIDATDKDGDLLFGVPYGLAGRQALILVRGHSRLMRIPDYAPESNRLVIERSMKLDERGHVAVREVLTFHGYYASYARSYMKSIEPAHRQAAIQRLLADYQDSAEIRTLEVGALEERTQPLRVELTYLCRGCFQHTGGKWLGRLPAPMERCYMGDSHQEERRTPFQFEFPLVIESVVDFEVPAGHVVTEPEKWAGEGSRAPFVWTLHGAAEGTALTARFKATRTAGTFPVEAYAPYQEAVREAIGALRCRLVLSKPAK